MLQQHLETQQLYRELEQKLKAQELGFNARGDVIDTAPSGSNGPTGPVMITTTTPKPPKGDETLKKSSSTKSGSNRDQESQTASEPEEGSDAEDNASWA